MSALKISRELALPLESVTDTIGVIAVKGSGKSYTFMVMAEEMVRSGAPVVIIDVVGVCWGLRTSADGKHEGLPIVVLGGEHGDLPLDPNAGRVLAEFAASERRSMVLDVSAFDSKADQIRFVTAFVSRLYEVNREPLHVMIDEADEFIPQKPFGEETRMVRAFEVLVRRGRARGLGITMVTQRPAVLNKNVLTMVGTLIIGRVSAPQDRKAIGEWVDAHGTPEQKATLWKSLAALPTTDKWVWAPLADIFTRVTIRPRETFDSSATPKLGAVRLAPVDLETLRSKMADTIQKALLDDPNVLRARIVKLKRGARIAAANAPTKTIEVPVLSTEDITVLENYLESLAREEEEWTARVDQMRIIVATIGEWGAKVRDALARVKTSGNAARETMVVPRTSGGEKLASSRAEPPKSAAPARADDGALGAGLRKILTALAQHPEGLDRAALALMSGYAKGGGSFRTYLSALRVRGLLVENGKTKITNAGLRELGPFEPLPTGKDLLEHWKRDIGKSPSRILDELADVHPRALTKAALASRTGMEAAGGSFRTYLSKLRVLGLIRGSGELRISPELVG